MRMNQRIRCPACGMLALEANLEQAGTHELERRVGRSLGRGRGFAWSKDALTVDDLERLAAELEAAHGQIMQLIAEAEG
jgi:hypothetical protein